MADDPVKLTVRDTPDRLRPAAEEAARFLAGVLRELAALEDGSFAQYIRLCRKGTVVEFQGGVRREFTDIRAWKDERKRRFAALLDPHCTEKLISRRRDCLHSTHFPSSFDCLRTGCELIAAVRSAQKAEVQVIPEDGGIPFDLSDRDVRYLVEDMRRGGHSAQYYDYFQKFRFILRREGEGWRIDEVYSAASGADRWRRDLNF